MSPGELAEARIADLGIKDPRDLDVEAIAADARMTVEYEELEGVTRRLSESGTEPLPRLDPRKSAVANGSQSGTNSAIGSFIEDCHSSAGSTTQTITLLRTSLAREKPMSTPRIY